MLRQAEAKLLEGLARRGSEACLRALHECSPSRLPPPAPPLGPGHPGACPEAHAGRRSRAAGCRVMLQRLGSAPPPQSGACPAGPRSTRSPEAALRLAVLGELGRTLSRAQSAGQGLAGS